MLTSLELSQVESGSPARPSCCSSRPQWRRRAGWARPRLCSTASPCLRRTITLRQRLMGTRWLALRTLQPSSPGRLGTPGTADAERVPMNGGLALSPQPETRRSCSRMGRRTRGATTGPGFGEAFFVNTVNGHLWHAAAGATSSARTRSTPTRGSIPHQPARRPPGIGTHSKDWTDSRKVTGEHDPAAAASADHMGARDLIWATSGLPRRPRGKLFTADPHGPPGQRRAKARPRGSGARRTSHEPVDRPVRGRPLVSRARPERWSCSTWRRVRARLEGHRANATDSNGVHRTSGRIYKVEAAVQPTKRVEVGDPAEATSGLWSRPSASSYEWYVRMARRQPRRTRGPRRSARPGTGKALRTMLDEDPDPCANPSALDASLGSKRRMRRYSRKRFSREHESMRVWAIRLPTDRTAGHGHKPASSVQMSSWPKKTSTHS